MNLFNVALLFFSVIPCSAAEYGMQNNNPISVFEMQRVLQVPELRDRIAGYVLGVEPNAVGSILSSSEKVESVNRVLTILSYKQNHIENSALSRQEYIDISNQNSPALAVWIKLKPFLTGSTSSYPTLTTHDMQIFEHTPPLQNIVFNKLKQRYFTRQNVEMPYNLVYSDRELFCNSVQTVLSQTSKQTLCGVAIFGFSAISLLYMTVHMGIANQRVLFNSTELIKKCAIQAGSIGAVCGASTGLISSSMKVYEQWPNSRIVADQKYLFTSNACAKIKHYQQEL